MPRPVTNVLTVAEYVTVLDPRAEFVRGASDGTRLSVRTVPGCWGPMITPDLPGGHEVSRPVYVDGALPGDTIALWIRSIRQVSSATTSGTHKVNEAHTDGDPGVAAKCPACGRVNPKTYLVNDGGASIRCVECDVPVKPYELADGYTMVFDDAKRVGVTVSDKVAAEIREHAWSTMAMPEGARQYPVNLIATGSPHCIASRVELMIGNIGTVPAIPVSSSKNAKDAAWRMIDDTHPLAVPANRLNLLTDGHMDSNEVREGAVVLCPVRVPGGGVYLGDVHAMQGDGELAGHTTDVVADVEIDIQVIKGLDLPGPALLPREEDLPRILRPLSRDEWQAARKLAETHGLALQANNLPIEFIGTGRDLNTATFDALERISSLTGLSVDQVRNWCTISGGVRISRLAGVVQVGLRITPGMADQWGLLEIFETQYPSSFVAV